MGSCGRCEPRLIHDPAGTHGRFRFHRSGSRQPCGLTSGYRPIPAAAGREFDALEQPFNVGADWTAAQVAKPQSADAVLAPESVGNRRAPWIARSALVGPVDRVCPPREVSPDLDKLKQRRRAQSLSAN